MSSNRKILETIILKEALEGAGVHLHRGFGFGEVPRFDPFLLFDDFSSPNPLDYLPGFPMHPHRGIETVTYVLKGDVHHKDSMQNEGYIGAGDVQWMTAGSGIIHEEMPEGTDGLIGFQLWVNLPSTHKMMKPRYQEITAEQIPQVTNDGVRVAIIAGTYAGTRGPVEDIMANPTYLDITLSPHTSLTMHVPEGDTAFIYVVRGSCTTRVGAETVRSGTIALFERTGGDIHMTSDEAETQILFVSGTPLGEPVAWHGPIVMNTADEIRTALYGLQNGTFLK
jgi:redox-sensitive bicupin YhaK (pirin superfamily)